LTVFGAAIGCASSGGGSGEEAAQPAADAGDSVGTIPIVVENRINPPQSLTVTLVSVAAGSRRILGSVGPGRTVTLSFEHGALAGESWNLIAQTQAGTEITSTPFRLRAGANIRWSLPRNGLSIGP
jgi:hypothetical protein